MGLRGLWFGGSVMHAGMVLFGLKLWTGVLGVEERGYFSLGELAVERLGKVCKIRPWAWGFFCEGVGERATCSTTSTLSASVYGHRDRLFSKAGGMDLGPYNFLPWSYDCSCLCFEPSARYGSGTLRSFEESILQMPLLCGFFMDLGALHTSSVERSTRIPFHEGFTTIL